MFTNSIEITDSAELTLIINSMNKVNQVMKKISENIEGYVVSHEDIGLVAESYEKQQTPRRVKSTLLYSGLNSKQKAIFDKYKNLLSYSVESPSGLFEWIRDFKKGLSSITILEDEVILKSGLVEFRLGRRPNEYFMKDTLIVDESICNFELEDEGLKEELYSKKGVFKLFTDIENQTISLDKIPENSESYLKLVISHKYLTGFSGMKADKSNLNIRINFTNLDNVFLIVITISNKSFITENHFCVIDC